MNCKHCNMPIKEEEHFCSNCEKSTEVQDATREHQTNFKLKKVAVLVGLAVVIVIGVISTVKVRSGINKGSIEIQLSLGEKYLEELECDKAIFVFNEAIQMKPRNVRAYLGLAQAYEGIGELANATDVVVKGLEYLAEDMKKEELEGVASLYLKLIGLYEKIGVHEKSAQAVKEGYELTKNSELRRLNNRYFPTVDISLAPGEYDKKQQISLTTKGTKIYYTTDGSEPNKDSKIYTEEITILADTLLKGVVENEYGLLGDILTWEYQIKFEDSVIKWKDEALELYVKEFLGKSIDEPVYVSEVSGLGEVIISGTRMVEEFFNLGGEIRTTGEIKSLQDLVHFKSLTSLCVEYNNVSDLSSLSELKYLNELFLDNNNISDLSPLSDLSNLTYVYLNNNNISDLSPLSKLTNLTTLELHNNKISDLSPLSELVNLDGLGIENSNISDLSPLSKLVNMTELHLNNNNISDLSPLSELVNLNYVYLSNNKISDLGPLSKLENLYMLVIDNNTISDLTPLSELENLDYIELNNNNISDLRPLSGLGNLYDIYLSYNNISDLSPLSELVNLNRLRLGNNNISDLSPLSGLRNLRYLDLDSNKISDLRPLSKLKIVNKLDLYNNNISDLSPLSGFMSLTYLDLFRNNISDLSPLSDLWSLTELHLGYNNISDLSPLSELNELTCLSLWDNPITDWTPVEYIDTVNK